LLEGQVQKAAGYDGTLETLVADGRGHHLFLKSTGLLSQGPCRYYVVALHVAMPGLLSADPAHVADAGGRALPLYRTYARYVHVYVRPETEIESRDAMPAHKKQKKSGASPYT
jgi:hypothetical protein